MHTIKRIAVAAVIAGATLLGTSPAWAAPAQTCPPSCTGSITANVTIQSTLTLSLSTNTLDYGNATPGTAQLPVVENGINPDHSFNATVNTNDTHGFTLSSDALDWTDGATPTPHTFPASSFAAQVLLQPSTTYGSSIPFVEATGHAAATLSTMTSPGNDTFQVLQSLTVPTTAPAASYSSAITETAVAS